MKSKCYDSTIASESIMALIKEKLQDKITEKQLIQKNINPYLFHELAERKLAKNIQAMANGPFKQDKRKEIEDVEPKKLQKDNMNPKCVQVDKIETIRRRNISNGSQYAKLTSKHCSFIYSSHSKVQNQRFNDLSKRRFRPMTSRQNNQTVNAHMMMQSNNHSNSRSNFVKNIQFFSKTQTLINKKQKIKIRKTDNFVKLLESKQQVPDFFQDIEKKLRSKIIEKEKQTFERNQLETLKSLRFQRLKQRFNEEESNGEHISFDFDGSIINFNNQNLKQNQIEQVNDNIQKILRSNQHFDQNQKVQIKSLQSFYDWRKLHQTHQTQRGSQNIKRQMQSQNQTNLPHQTLYMIRNQNQNHMKHDKQNESNKILKSLLTGSRKTSIQRSQNVRASELSIYSHMKILKQSNSKQKNSIKRSKNNISNPQQVKIFNDTSSRNKYSNHTKKQTEEIQQKQKQFHNNFNRQTSTIPYLQLNEGIKYTQQITQFKENQQKQTYGVRFATIEKSKAIDARSISNKNYNGYETSRLSGNLTFRSYLPISSNQKRNNNPFDNSEEEFSRNSIGTTSRLSKHQNVERNERRKNSSKLVDFDKNLNTISINEQIHRPFTTEALYRSKKNQPVNMIENGKTSDKLKQAADTKKNTLLDMKNNFITRQKLRVMSSHTKNQ